MLSTSARDEALLEEIAQYFEILAQYFESLASDREAMAQRIYGSKRENLTRAKVWREAASDVRSIKLVQP